MQFVEQLKDLGHFWFTDFFFFLKLTIWFYWIEQ